MDVGLRATDERCWRMGASPAAAPAAPWAQKQGGRGHQM